MKTIIKMTAACPNCNKHVGCEGEAGQKIILKCPNCGTKGFVILQEKYGIKKVERKHRSGAIGITKKRLVSYSVAGFLAIVFVFGVLIPTLQGSLHFLIVLSGSMQPAINTGDVVVTQAADIDDVSVGDVVTFRQPSISDPNRCVTHRVMDIIYDDGGIYLQTKGDVNEEPDFELVESSNLIGKVTFTIPYVGYFPHYARQPVGLVVLIFIPGFLIIVGEIWNILKIRRKELEEMSE